MEPLISVIIPVYNVERYMDKCIDSVLEQTYRNLEVILIDDGSTDGSGIKCDIWKKKDDRIIAIHKNNGGLSDARNAGLDIAKGDYITCIDSDDFVSKDYVEYLYKLIVDNGAEISCCGNHTVNDDGNDFFSSKKTISKIYVFDREEAITEMLYGKLFSNSAWGKLYKADFFSTIRYPKGIYYEDLYTTHKLIFQCEKFAFGTERKYYYLIRKTGISGDSDVRKRLDAIKAEKMLIEFVKINAPSALEAAKFKIMTDSMICITLCNLKTQNTEEKELIIRLWKYVKGMRLKGILSKRISKKYNILCFVSLFGKRVFKIFYKLVVKGF